VHKAEHYCVALRFLDRVDNKVLAVKQFARWAIPPACGSLDRGGCLAYSPGILTWALYRNGHDAQFEQTPLPELLGKAQAFGRSPYSLPELTRFSPLWATALCHHPEPHPYLALTMKWCKKQAVHFRISIKKITIKSFLNRALASIRMSWQDCD
jgi:hypothetical protein